MNIFIKIGILFSFIYPLKIHGKLIALRNFIYTGWIKNKFKKFDGIAEYSIFFHNSQCISVGESTNINMRARIMAWTSYNGIAYNPIIEIGKNSSIGSDCFLSAVNKIYIGDNVAITARTLVLDNVHGNFNESSYTFTGSSTIPDVFLKNVKTRQLYSRGPVIIEDNVHIGENCVIMPGVTIGHNSVVSANSVIVKDIPPYSIVAGNPGKLIISFGG